MRSGWLALLLLPVAAGAAHADWYTYSAWQALSPGERTAYISGAFDSYVAFTSSSDTSNRFTACLTRQKLTSAQLASHIVDYANSHADAQKLPIPIIMVRYLADLCGPLP